VCSSPQDTRVPFPSSIPDSQDPGSQADSYLEPDGLTNCRPGDNKLVEQFGSNTIDASYIFSDDDDVPLRVPNKVTATPTSSRMGPTLVGEASSRNLGPHTESPLMSIESCSNDTSPMHLAKPSRDVQEARSTSLQRLENRIIPKPGSAFLSRLDRQINSEQISKPSPCQEARVLPNLESISELQSGQNSISSACKNIAPTHQSRVEVRRPSMGSYSTNKLTVHREDLPTQIVQELLNTNQVPLPKAPLVPIPASTRDPVSKPDPPSPKPNSNLVLKPNSASKSTAFKSKASKPTLSSPPRPVSKPELQSATSLLDPVSKSGVISRSSPSQNVGLLSKYSTESKVQRLTPAKKPDPWKARLSMLLADDDFDELSMEPDDFAKQHASSSHARPSPAYQKPKSHIRRLADKMEGTPSRVSTSKSTARQVELSTGGGSDLDNPLIETPGGSTRKCGESGFKCGRNFCFKCE
jgi:hypothetical protein